MFRLIELHPDGRAAVYLDRDGYTNVVAAWAAYVLAPGEVFGVGRLDAAGRLVEVVIDSTCPVHRGTVSRPPLDPVDAVDIADGAAGCPECAWRDRTVDLDRLALALGTIVRPATFSVHQASLIRMNVIRMLSSRIRGELADRVGDPAWRRSICAALSREPLATDGLVEAVANLGDADVLELFPALRHLADGLPARVRRELRDSIHAGPWTTAAAALRLGLTAQPHASR